LQWPIFRFCLSIIKNYKKKRFQIWWLLLLRINATITKTKRNQLKFGRVSDHLFLDILIFGFFSSKYAIFTFSSLTSLSLSLSFFLFVVILVNTLFFLCVCLRKTLKSLVWFSSLSSLNDRYYCYYFIFCFLMKKNFKRESPQQKKTRNQVRV